MPVGRRNLHVPSRQAELASPNTPSRFPQDFYPSGTMSLRSKLPSPAWRGAGGEANARAAKLFKPEKIFLADFAALREKKRSDPRPRETPSRFFVTSDFPHP